MLQGVGVLVMVNPLATHPIGTVRKVHRVGCACSCESGSCRKIYDNAEIGPLSDRTRARPRFGGKGFFMLACMSSATADPSPSSCTCRTTSRSCGYTGWKPGPSKECSTAMSRSSSTASQRSLTASNACDERNRSRTYVKVCAWASRVERLSSRVSKYPSQSSTRGLVDSQATYWDSTE